MSKTVQQAGRLVAAYIDNGQGRRVVLGEPEDRVGGGLLGLGERVEGKTLVVGRTQAEVKACIATLYQLLEELPVDEGPDPRGTPSDPRAL